VLCCPCLLLVLPVGFFGNNKVLASKYAALSHAKQIGIAAIMYSGDNDDRLPSATRWIDQTSSYKGAGIDWEMTCRSPKAYEENHTSYGFAFRRSLSAHDVNKIDDLTTRVLIFDSTILTRNASSELDTLPKPGRYDGTNIIGFADGHAKFARDGTRIVLK